MSKRRNRGIGSSKRRADAFIDRKNAESIAKRRQELRASLFISDADDFQFGYSKRSGEVMLDSLDKADCLCSKVVDFLMTDKEQKRKLCDDIVSTVTALQDSSCLGERYIEVSETVPHNDVFDYVTNIEKFDEKVFVRQYIEHIPVEDYEYVNRESTIPLPPINYCYFSYSEFKHCAEELGKCTVSSPITGLTDVVNVEALGRAVYQIFPLLDETKVIVQNCLVPKVIQDNNPTYFQNSKLIDSLVERKSLCYHDYISFVQTGTLVCYAETCPSFSLYSDYLFNNIPSDNFILKYSKVANARRVKIQVQNRMKSYTVFCYFANPTSVMLMYYIRKHLRFKVNVM